MRRRHADHRRRAAGRRPVRPPGSVRHLNLHDRIHREGPVRFDVAVEELLYGEDGFFTGGGGAGRRADFLTSPEVGPLFAAVVARALDAEWRRLGAPDPYVVVESGAGRGTLVRAVLDAEPACAGALRYVCVERSAALRDEIESSLPTEPATHLLGSVVHDDEEVLAAPGRGPVVSLLDELPYLTVTGVVLANELLDNLPFRLVERTGRTWNEILVGTHGERLVEVSVPAASAVAAEANGLAPGAPVGARLPLQHAAAEWVRRAIDVLDRGRVVVVDYADDSPSLAARPWAEWLRTYRGHGRGGAPLDDPGTQDVTCEVAVDQLPPPASNRAQAEWLAQHGVFDLAAEAKAAWEARAHIGDLEALRHRSRMGEAVALTDPDGLGAFRVLEWVV